jgi:aminocarboxymuconate-semialdehyde decarboxylase
MTVVDVHSHFVPESVLVRASAPGGLFGARLSADGHLTHPEGFSYPVRAGAEELEERDALRDRQGVDVSVLSLVPSLFFYDQGPASVEYLAETNDELAQVVSGSSRLLGLAAIPMHEPEAAADELRRAVTDLGLCGAQIGTTVAPGEYLEAPRLEPVLAAASELGVPLMPHPYYVGPTPGLEDFYFTNTIGNPVETSLVGARLVLSGVLDRFPDLRVILVHGAGFLPYQLGRLDRAAAVRPEARTATAQKPSEYLGRFWADSITHSPRALAYLSSVMPGRVLLGTDTPFDMGEPDPVGSARAAGLDPHDLGRAALALLMRPVGSPGTEAPDAGGGDHAAEHLAR